MHVLAPKESPTIHISVYLSWLNHFYGRYLRSNHEGRKVGFQRCLVFTLALVNISKVPNVFQVLGLVLAILKSTGRFCQRIVLTKAVEKEPTSILGN